LTSPRFIDPAETRYSHARTDAAALGPLVEMNDRLAFAGGPADDAHGSVFIIGLPRSGTTLTYQIAAAGTDAGYINNLIARFWESPAYGVYLCRHLGLDRRISFASKHGSTVDVTDVTEFGYFWASLFGTKSNAALADIDPARIDWARVRAKLLSINAAFGRPCVHKQTLAGHVLPHLAAALDRRLFVYVRRDFLEVAVSLLRVRKARYGDLNAWFSLKPREYDRLRSLSPHEQVVAQLDLLHKDLEEQCRAAPAGSLWDVEYDDLCADPTGFLNGLVERAAAAGIRIGLTERPAPFAASTPDPADEDVRLLARYLDQYGMPYKDRYRGSRAA
jgi:hypothetical protein